VKGKDGLQEMCALRRSACRCDKVIVIATCSRLLNLEGIKVVMIDLRICIRKFRRSLIGISTTQEDTWQPLSSPSLSATTIGVELDRTELSSPIV